MKVILGLTLCLLMPLSAFSQEQKEIVGYPAQLYTGEDGCSKEIAKKARKVNRIVGGVGGVAAVGLSSVSFPFSWVFLLGGLAATGESAFDIGHEKMESTYKEKLKMKSFIETPPRIRYPIARKYYDLLNSVELIKVMERNKDDSMLNESIKIYLYNAYLMTTMKRQYKYCKNAAQKQGLAKDEIAMVEANLMEYTDLIINPENKPENSNAAPFSTEALTKAKEDYASCIMNLSDANGNYPVFETLLAKSELQETNLLSWRMKGVLRLYMKVMKEAEKKGIDLTIDAYLAALKTLDTNKTLCTPKVKNRKEVIKLILESSVQ